MSKLFIFLSCLFLYQTYSPIPEHLDKNGYKEEGEWVLVPETGYVVLTNPQSLIDSCSNEHVAQMLACGLLSIREHKDGCAIEYRGETFVAERVKYKYRDVIDNIGPVRCVTYLKKDGSYCGQEFNNKRTFIECLVMVMFIVDNMDPSTYCSHYKCIGRVARAMDIVKRTENCCGNDRLVIQGDIEHEKKFVEFAYNQGLLTDEEYEYGSRFFEVLHKIRLAFHNEGMSGIHSTKLFNALTEELEKHGIDWRASLLPEEHAKGTKVASDLIMNTMCLPESYRYYVEKIVQSLVFRDLGRR